MTRFENELAILLDYSSRNGAISNEEAVKIAKKFSAHLLEMHDIDTMEDGNAYRFISVNKSLPEQDEEVIVLVDDLNSSPNYKIAFGHVVDKQKFKDSKAVIKGDNLIITTYQKDDITLEKGLFSKKAEFFEEVYGIKPILKQKKDA